MDEKIEKELQDYFDHYANEFTVAITVSDFWDIFEGYARTRNTKPSNRDVKLQGKIFADYCDSEGWLYENEFKEACRDFLNYN